MRRREANERRDGVRKVWRFEVEVEVNCETREQAVQYRGEIIRLFPWLKDDDMPIVEVEEDW